MEPLGSHAVRLRVGPQHVGRLSLTGTRTSGSMYMHQVQDKGKRVGKERMAAHIYVMRKNKGKPVTKNEARELVDEVFDAMYVALANGYTVYFSNFGSLTPITKENVRVLNPRTRKLTLVKRHTRVRWMPSRQLRDIVNGRSRYFTVRKRGKTLKSTEV